MNKYLRRPESYKHLMAKEVLARWFRAASTFDDYVQIPPADFRANRHGPYYGVWVEYPVALDRDGELIGVGACDRQIWDEWGLDYEDRVPTYAELMARKLIPYVVFDVACTHKGGLRCAFEVVHKSPVSAEKLEKLKRIKAESGDWGDFFVYEIEAEWILTRVQPPDRLECRQII